MYNSQEELFSALKPAFNVKLRLVNSKYNYLKATDIWNYLKINKWCKDKNLSISQMVNDIIDVTDEKVDLFLKEHLKNENRKLYREDD